MVSEKFYSAASKVFVVSNSDKEKIEAMANRNWTRYGTGMIMMFWGLAASAWVMGWNFIL